jgi:hypothetical protein
MLIYVICNCNNFSKFSKVTGAMLSQGFKPELSKDIFSLQDISDKRISICTMIQALQDKSLHES